MIKRALSSKKQQQRKTTADQRPAAQIEAPTYRRNRTMTNRSTVPEVTERARVNYLRSVRRKIGFIFIVVILCMIIIAIATSQFSSSVKVVTSQPDLVNSLDSEKYETLFDAYYKKHPLERFRFLTNYPRLVTSLQQAAPEIEAVEPAGIEHIGVSRYELVARRPVASWVVDDKRYYVDADGVTFTHNYYQEPTVSVVDNSGAHVVQGSAIASSRLLSFVGRVISLSSNEGLAITSIEIPTQSMRQLNLKGKGLPTVRVTIDRGVEAQVGDMAAAVRHLKKTGHTPKYVDVRVRGKAFYR